MLKYFRHGIMASLVSVSALTASTTALANDNQPTRLVVGFSPGGAADVLARSLAEWLHEYTGNVYIVENRPGASARIALEHVKQAKPDGKTILITSPSPITVFPLTYTSEQLRYDPDVDLEPIAHLVDAPQALFVGAEHPAQNIEEYLDSITDNADEASVGIVTLGSPTHFSLVALAESTGVPIVPVPYSGVAPMLTDIISVVLPAGINPIVGQIEQKRSGKIRFLAITGEQRSALLPDLPTMSEAGFDEFSMASGWFAAYAPKDTPAELIAELEENLLLAMQDEKIIERLNTLALEPTGLTAEELRERVQNERAYWAPIIEPSGFTHGD